MTLIYPWVLLLFVLYPLFIYIVSKFGTKRVFGNLAMLRRVSDRSISIEKILYPLILFLILLTASYPVRVGSEEVSIKSSRDILFLLDASSSMREDKRFEVAKEILSEFIKSRQGDRVGLVVFGDRAYTASPLSRDISGIEMILKSLKTGVAGGRDTALYEAIYLGIGLFEKSGDRPKSIVLLTDGIDTIKDMPLDVARQKLKSRGIKLYAIGIGSDYRKDILQSLAESSGGAIFTAQSSKELRDIYNKINLMQSSSVVKKRVDRVESLYRYPLILALLLMVIVLFRVDDWRFISLSMLFAFLALLYPKSYIDKHTTKDKALAVVLDISRDMRVRDIPPNRYGYVISRVKELIYSLPPSYAIALMAFDDRVYLISPPTDDKDALMSKIVHLRVKLDREGSALVDSLILSSKLLKRYRDKKIVLITSSLVDNRQLDRVKGIDIPISVYGVATLKGGGVPSDEGAYMEDSRGRVIISYLDTKLADIASHTGGVFSSFDEGVDGWRRIKDSLYTTQTLSSKGLQDDSRGILWILLALSGIFLLLSRGYPYIKAIR